MYCVLCFQQADYVLLLQYSVSCRRLLCPKAEYFNVYLAVAIFIREVEITYVDSETYQAVKCQL